MENETAATLNEANFLVKDFLGDGCLMNGGFICRVGDHGSIKKKDRPMNALHIVKVGSFSDEKKGFFILNKKTV